MEAGQQRARETEARGPLTRLAKASAEPFTTARREARGRHGRAATALGRGRAAAGRLGGGAGSTREAPREGAVGGHGAGARWGDSRCGCQPPSHRNALTTRVLLVERGVKGVTRARHPEFW